jgi:hypothetical protein
VLNRNALNCPTHSLGPSEEAVGQRFLTIPEDAGRYRDALTMILLRIPTGWDQAITCGAGWYPLIARLHSRLCDLDVDYEVHQVTETTGALRYAAQPSAQDRKVRAQFFALLDEAKRHSAGVCKSCGRARHTFDICKEDVHLVVDAGEHPALAAAKAKAVTPEQRWRGPGKCPPS